MSKLVEKIAYVELTHDDGKNTPFALFYGTNKFPTDFPLKVVVNFMNLLPNKEYKLEVNIQRDSFPLVQHDEQKFVVPEESMVLMNDGYGQAFIKTGILFKISQSGTYHLKFSLKHLNITLDEFSIYSYIGDR
ncbi:hypothetical protein MXZ89_04170 [Streptococcus uberis]|uniref:hypothetical protein n=1 Tax=Streptococcus uberis TaxID=1349 RepID=UPI001FF14CF2|nr:hypothetical protein [Streptococcus uberis]MCK1216544.1 hypothetical protein [Streptococcus uberis]